MYAKLVLKNAQQSIKDYLIYIVTMTICVALFYSFLSITSRYYHPNIGVQYDLSLMGDAMTLSISCITLLMLFLIYFVNHYMLQRKQKAFAIQSIIGMEQKVMARIFFAETFLMGLLAILIGVLLGVFCSQFVTALLLTTYGKKYVLSWTLFPDTVLLTILFFIGSYLLVGLFNTRRIQKTKIIDMLYAAQKNERALKHNRWMKGMAILYTLLSILMFASSLNITRVYYDVRFPWPVHVMFIVNLIVPVCTVIWALIWRYRKNKRTFTQLLAGFSLAAILNTVAAASVPSFTKIFQLPLSAENFNTYLLYVLINLLFLICSIIYLVGDFLLNLKDKSPTLPYKNENLFFFGQIGSKLNTTSKTMSLIAITLALSIFMLMLAPILINWAFGYLNMRAIYDIQIYSAYNQVYEEKNLKNERYEIVSDFLEKHHIKTTGDRTFNLYLPNRSDFHQRNKYDFPSVAISLSDYNAILKMLGHSPIHLGENEFTTQWRTTASDEAKNQFLEDPRQLKTDAGILTRSNQSLHETNIGETAYNFHTDLLYIFPDKVCQSLLSVNSNRYIKTEKPLTYNDAASLSQLFTARYPENAKEHPEYGIRLRTLQVNSTKAACFLLQSAMTYLAVVLMVICLTILSLQQLLDANQYHHRFSILRRLGVDEDRIEKLILKQLALWFGLPITIAIVVAGVVIYCFIQMNRAKIALYIGLSALLSQLGITIGILALLLICYFIITWLLFHRSVQ